MKPTPTLEDLAWRMQFYELGVFAAKAIIVGVVVVAVLWCVSQMNWSGMRVDAQEAEEQEKLMRKLRRDDVSDEERYGQPGDGGDEWRQRKLDQLRKLK